MDRAIFRLWAESWPSPYVAREEIDKFSGGIFTAKYMANLDSMGRGPKGRIRCGRKVAYEVSQLLTWIENRSSALD